MISIVSELSKRVVTFQVYVVDSNSQWTFFVQNTCIYMVDRDCDAWLNVVKFENYLLSKGFALNHRNRCLSLHRRRSILASMCCKSSRRSNLVDHHLIDVKVWSGLKALTWKEGKSFRVLSAALVRYVTTGSRGDALNTGIETAILCEWSNLNAIITSSKD